MDKVVIGIFSHRSDAEGAISELEFEDYNPKDISIMMKDTREADRFAEKTGLELSVCQRGRKLP